MVQINVSGQRTKKVSREVQQGVSTAIFKSGVGFVWATSASGAEVLVKFDAVVNAEKYSQI